MPPALFLSCGNDISLSYVLSPSPPLPTMDQGGQKEEEKEGIVQQINALIFFFLAHHALSHVSPHLSLELSHTPFFNFIRQICTLNKTSLSVATVRYFLFERCVKSMVEQDSLTIPICHDRISRRARWDMGCQDLK